MVVIAILTPAPGREDEVQAALIAAVAATHEQDAGCELYAAHRVTRGRPGFVVVEKWVDAPALSAHGTGPAFTALAAALDGLLAEPLDATLLEPLPAGSAEQGQL
ncbi:putative quinol monooxygenase [Klenkia brasiliensis]|uniref:putative quinol monooxygenase n=1 Tax=Klenkia brasiliensis TaxID=333142 RepID=UPI001A96EDE5|nr:antibiotic biosynthesis monooxygenase family protein [Klenkia brasiliensis]